MCVSVRGVGVTDVNGWRLVIVSGVRKVRNDVCLTCGVVGGVSASEEKEKEIGVGWEKKKETRMGKERMGSGTCGEGARCESWKKL